MRSYRMFFFGFRIILFLKYRYRILPSYDKAVRFRFACPVVGLPVLVFPRGTFRVVMLVRR